MTALLITLNILAGLFLIGVVLLQSGKGADMGAAFGGSSSAVFGPSGAGNVLTKITAATAAVFMGTSLALAVITSREQSLFDEMPEPTPVTAPAADTPAAAARPATEPPQQPDSAAGDLGPAGAADRIREAAESAAAAVDKTVDDAGKAPAAGAGEATPTSPETEGAPQTSGGAAAAKDAEQAPPGAPAAP